MDSAEGAIIIAAAVGGAISLLGILINQFFEAWKATGTRKEAKRTERYKYLNSVMSQLLELAAEIEEGLFIEDIGAQQAYGTDKWANYAKSLSKFENLAQSIGDREINTLVHNLHVRPRTDNTERGNISAACRETIRILGLLINEQL